MTKRTRQVENTWPCASCGATNKGRFLKCEKCGAFKEKGTKDVVPDPASAATVTDPELLKMATQGANWSCEFCNGQTRDATGKCVNCAAPKPLETPPTSDGVDIQKGPKSEISGDASISFDDGVVRIRSSNGGKINGLVVNGRTYNTRDGKVEVTENGKPVKASIAGASVTGKKKKISWPLVGAILGGVALFALIGFLVAPWEENVKVSSLSWNYKSDLHQKTLMHGEDWGSPIGSFNVSCSSKYYGDENCNAHDCRPHTVSYDCNCSSYECNCRESCKDNGNGFSTCTDVCSTCQKCSTCSKTEYDTCYDSCPVYKDWCKYDYYEWPIIKTMNTAGSKHDEHWPELEAFGPDQRINRTEKYEVEFLNEKKTTRSYHPSNLTDFARFQDGASWRIKVNRLHIVAPLNPLP